VRDWQRRNGDERKGRAGGQTVAANLASSNTPAPKMIFTAAFQFLKKFQSQSSAAVPFTSFISGPFSFADHFMHF